MISAATHIDPPAVAATLTRPPREAAIRFAEHLTQATGTDPTASLPQAQRRIESVAERAGASVGPEGRTERSRHIAEEFVAAAFLEPLLAQIRESSTAAEPFAPTTAEKRFGPLLDQRIAHNVVRGARFPLVDRIQQQLLRSPGAGGTSHVA